jgi:hypothetical protein
MVACEGPVNPRFRWQVGCSVADRLDARLLIIRDDCNFAGIGIGRAQNCDLTIDAEHLGYFRFERIITPFEIIANLMRLDVMAGEDLADRALGDIGHARIPGGRRMLTRMARQQPGRPKLVRIPQVFGFLAGQ